MKKILQDGTRVDVPVKIWSVGESLKVMINGDRTYVFHGEDLEIIRKELDYIEKYGVEKKHPL